MWFKKWFINNHSDNNLGARWELAEIEINQHLNKIFKKNPLLYPGNYYFWKKNKMHIKLEMIESFNFYVKKHEIIVEQKPVFSNNNGFLVIDFKKQHVYFKTQSYNVEINILDILFLKLDNSIESDGYDTFKHSIHLTNIFSTNNAVFKFLSIEPLKTVLILHIMIRVLKAKSLYLHKISNFIKIKG